MFISGTWRQVPRGSRDLTQICAVRSILRAGAADLIKERKDLEDEMAEIDQEKERLGKRKAELDARDKANNEEISGFDFLFLFYF